MRKVIFALWRLLQRRPQPDLYNVWIEGLLKEVPPNGRWYWAEYHHGGWTVSAYVRYEHRGEISFHEMSVARRTEW